MQDRRYLGNLYAVLAIAEAKPESLRDKAQIKRLRKSIANELIRLMSE